MGRLSVILRNVLERSVESTELYPGRAAGPVGGVAQKLFAEMSAEASELLPLLLDGVGDDRNVRALDLSVYATKFLLSVAELVDGSHPSPQCLAMALRLADLLGLLPNSLPCRILLDTSWELYLTTLANDQLHTGAERLYTALNTRQWDVNNAVLAMAGAATVALASSTLLRSVRRVSAYFRGLSVFHTLDASQQEHALRNRAIKYLGKANTGQALLIDAGLNSTLVDRVPDPFFEHVYEHCEVHACKVNSREELLEALGTARPKFAIVAMSAHGAPGEIHLGPDYTFDAGDDEINRALANCLEEPSSLYVGSCYADSDVEGCSLLSELRTKLTASTTLYGSPGIYCPLFTRGGCTEGVFWWRSYSGGLDLIDKGLSCLRGAE